MNRHLLYTARGPAEMTIDSESKALNDHMAEYNEHIAKFLGGTKNAAPKARKSLNEIKKCTASLRKAIQEKANKDKDAAA